jgi:methyl-accepting chemotaxis protein
VRLRPCPTEDDPTMSAAAAPSSPLPVHAVDAATRDAGFFAYHGIWAPGVRLFRTLRFAAKAAIISTAFMLPMMALLAWMLTTQADEAMQARMNAVRQAVEVVHGIVAAAQAEETRGALSREQAQALAIRQIGTLRYDRAEYFWINDMQPRMVMHPIKPELNGKDLGGMKDPNGLALFNTMVDIVRKDGKGFVAYQWPKPGHDTPVDKISYVQGFAPWGWVIGSGVYTGDLRDANARRLAWSGGVFAAALLIASYLFLSFYRVMDGGLKETRRHLRAMTAGDLTTSPSPWGNDEAAQLMLELRAMQESLRNIVTRVRGSSESIVSASSQIASASSDLSARTEQTAANLEQSASSMEEISSTVKRTAENVQDASQVASGNSESAARGGLVVAEVVRTMEDINASSRRISEIIGTIDGIAFQTNILALNAAVEAARAGEQGRGFAVVASEVRSLAQRSAQAAREIKTLITASVDKVESGTKVVRDAGQTMQELVANAQRMNELLSEISNTASEQSDGVAQVGAAVNELDRMTQQNAALVEQTAAASSALKDQAVGLAAEVDRFKLPLVG